MSHLDLQPIERLGHTVVRGVIGGQTIMNSWFWSFVDSTWGALTEGERLLFLNAVSEFFFDVIYDLVANFSTNQTQYQTAISYSPDLSHLSYFVNGLSGLHADILQGQIPVNAMATFDAWGFRLRPISPTLVRNGQKRFAGLPEEDQNNGVVLPFGAAIDPIIDFRTAVSTVHAISGDGFPTRGIRITIPKTERFLIDDKPSYRAVGGYWVDTCTLYDSVRHQDSRQRGIGI